MATSIRSQRELADPEGEPPVFLIHTDLAYCEVEIAADPLLFNRSLLSRRTKSNFFTSAMLSAGSSSTLRYVLAKEAWSLLGRHPYLYYRVVAYDFGLPASRRKVEASLEESSPQGAPYVYLIPSGTRPPPLRRRISGRLQWLRVENNKIVNEKGDTVVLRGVNRSGMEYSDRKSLDPSGKQKPTSREAAGITRSEIKEIVSHWKSNIIRLPINQEWALTRPDYLANIDTIIEWAASEEAYVLLSLHWFDNCREFGRTSDGKPNRVPPMPEENSVRVWSMLASRYRHDPAVLYDIFNEPHIPLTNDTTYAFIRPTDEEGWLKIWHSWVRRIEYAIHRQNNRALIFVSGWDWALSLQSFPVPLGRGQKLPNAVYSAHIYYHDELGRSTAKISDFDKWFGFPRLRSEHPIFLGEWGGEETNLAWGRSLEQYLRRLHKSENGIWQGLAGWTAWSWADSPLLVERGKGSRVTPGGRTLEWRTFVMDGTHNKLTTFGELVQGALQALP